jgi:hypothetical protein
MTPDGSTIGERRVVDLCRDQCRMQSNALKVYAIGMGPRVNPVFLSDLADASRLKTNDCLLL